MSEEWVPCYEAENYEVSDEGHVRNVKTRKLLKPDIDVYGRAIITLRINGRNCRKRIHRLMFESFYDIIWEKNKLNKERLEDFYNMYYRLNDRIQRPHWYYRL